MQNFSPLQILTLRALGQLVALFMCARGTASLWERARHDTHRQMLGAGRAT